jgi:lipopolysaccharide-induced tumor necrosis factor-alpha factor
VARSQRYDDDDDYGGPVRRRDEDDYDRPPRRDDYDDYEDDRPSRRRRDDDDDRFSLRRGFRCPYCRSREEPHVSNQISAAGWVVFVIMVLFCLPLCFIGLLMTEETRTCYDCGRQVS